MKAVGNFIIIKDNEVVQKNELGLIITEKSDNNIRYIVGEVITVGEDVKEVHPGQFVYFDKIAGSELRIKGDKFKAIRERDVVVTIDDVNTVI
jgi:co-chaperonin GroES (HSP10)